MIAPSISNNCAVSRRIRAICLLSMPELYPCSLAATYWPQSRRRQKNGGSLRSRRAYEIQTRLSGRFGHIRCLRPFRALHYFEFDRISFLQRTVTLADDRRIMYEHIGPVVPPNEPVPFGIIEPLYSSLHFVSPLAGDSNVSYSWGGMKLQSPP